MQTVGQPKSELKTRALLAKQRMKMGYWQQIMCERETMLEKAGENERSKKLISEVKREEIRRDAEIILHIDTAGRDEKMYEKVKCILSADELVTNPIGRLIEREIYESMDEEARQRYILKLSSKFRELKERFIKENIGKGIS
jgi:hypothetical protein